MEMPLRSYLADAQPVLASFLGSIKPVMGLILGSGLNPYADSLEDKRTLSYSNVPHMLVSTAEGHRGRFVLGRVPSTQAWVLCMQGRIHGYEGASAQEVAFPVWLMNQVGINTLFTTNAVGALNPAFSVGSFCAMTDHINLTGRNPLTGVEPSLMHERFVPMLAAYDEPLRALLLDCADCSNVTVNSGVYLGVLGPSFETPAEIRMFSSFGADTVAMSVVEEVIAARHCGMEVVGMSLVSNMACGIACGDPTSEEVMMVASMVEDDFERLVNCFIASVDALREG